MVCRANGGGKGNDVLWRVVRMMMMMMVMMMVRWLLLLLPASSFCGDQFGPQFTLKRHRQPLNSMSKFFSFLDLSGASTTREGVKVLVNSTTKSSKLDPFQFSAGLLQMVLDISVIFMVPQ